MYARRALLGFLDLARARAARRDRGRSSAPSAATTRASQRRSILPRSSRDSFMRLARLKSGMPESVGPRDAVSSMPSIAFSSKNALERGVVLQVEVLLALAHAIERRLRDVEVALLDDLRHLAEEERQQQRADVRAVDVGVGHQDDLVVAELADVEHDFRRGGMLRQRSPPFAVAVAIRRCRSALAVAGFPVRLAIGRSRRLAFGLADPAAERRDQRADLARTRACGRARARSTFRILPLSGRIA